METNKITLQETTACGGYMEIYLHTERSIYNAYTVPAIKRVIKATKAGEYGSANPERFAKDVQEITPAIQAAARLVRKYDGMQPTVQDIEAVTANYVAYIIEAAQYELQNA